MKLIALFFVSSPVPAVTLIALHYATTGEWS